MRDNLLCDSFVVLENCKNLLFISVMSSSQFRSKLSIATLAIHFCILTFPHSAHSTNQLFVTGRNREVGNKWTYLQMQQQHVQSGESLLPKKQGNRLKHVVTTRPPSHSNNNNGSGHFIRVPLDENACGIPKSKPLSMPYVIGGVVAHFGEFPWFAAITKYQHNSNPKWRVVCGASLLNSKYAITAAHCLHGRFKDTLEVVFNLKDTANITHTASGGEIRRKIARFVIHPQYNTRTHHDDIALIQFKEPINLRREKILAPICLPEKAGITFAGKNGVFTGFGHTSYGTGAPKENSRYLMKVQLPILSHSDCLRSKVPNKKNITENMICAGAKGLDACINDSGGPLMVTEKGRVVLVGISSWGIGCALPDYPGVYTRVTQYLPWIKTASSS